MKPHESPRINKKSIRGNSGDSWPLWNRGIFHTGHESRESPRIDFLLIRGGGGGGFVRFHYFFSPIVTFYESARFRYDVVTNIRGNRHNSAGIAQELITISKIT